MELQDWELTVEKLNEFNVKMGIMYVVLLISHNLRGIESASGVDFDDDDMPFREEIKPHIKVRFCCHAFTYHFILPAN